MLLLILPKDDYNGSKTFILTLPRNLHSDHTVQKYVWTNLHIKFYFKEIFGPTFQSSLRGLKYKTTAFKLSH